MPNPIATPLYRRLFWLGFAALVIAGLALADSGFSPNTVAGFAVMLAAVLPAYLWARGSVHGLPIFPIVALNYLGTYAIPLVSGHPGVMKYPESDRLLAAGTAIAYLLLATAVWYPLTAARPAAPARYLGFPESRTGGVFIVFLAFGCFFVS